MEQLARGWGRGQGRGRGRGRGLSTVWVYCSRRFAGGKGRGDGEKGNRGDGFIAVARRGEREMGRNRGGDLREKMRLEG